ncbi:MAG: hypothetical protein ABI822_21825 [Bryobacteraceae bacterium]
MTHSVNVTALSLLEAIGLAVAAFKESGIQAPGHMTIFTVTACQPETEHKVPMRKLEDWLSGSGRSPKEQLVKQRIKGLLGL